jgi:hypothetical protein
MAVRPAFGWSEARNPMNELYLRHSKPIGMRRRGEISDIASEASIRRDL